MKGAVGGFRMDRGPLYIAHAEIRCCLDELDDLLEPASDGRRKLALDLWEDLGRRPRSYAPGSTMYDLEKWLSRHSGPLDNG